MSYNMMIGYDIYDCFTMEHFRLRQRMTLTTKIYCSRLYDTKNAVTSLPLPAPVFIRTVEYDIMQVTSSMTGII
jgi:hypothetical protein